jgi:hypothetical protein
VPQSSSILAWFVGCACLSFALVTLVELFWLHVCMKTTVMFLGLTAWSTVKREDASVFTNKANGMCIKGKKIHVSIMAKGAGGKGRAEKAAGSRVAQNRDGSKAQHHGGSTPSNAEDKGAGHGYSELTEAAQAGGPLGGRQGKKQESAKAQNDTKAPQQGVQGAAKQGKKEQLLGSGAGAPKGNQQSTAEQAKSEENKKSKEAAGKTGNNQQKKEPKDDSQTSFTGGTVSGNAGCSDIGLGEVYRACALVSGVSMLDGADEATQSLGPGHFVCALTRVWRTLHSTLNSDYYVLGNYAFDGMLLFF